MENPFEKINKRLLDMQCVLIDVKYLSSFTQLEQMAIPKSNVINCSDCHNPFTVINKMLDNIALQLNEIINSINTHPKLKEDIVSHGITKKPKKVIKTKNSIQ